MLFREIKQILYAEDKDLFERSLRMVNLPFYKYCMQHIDIVYHE